MASGWLEELSRPECLRLLGTVPLGRVGLSVGALPVVLPVNFCLVEETIVFKTVPGTKLDAATAGAVVAFEADGYEPDGSAGWSVMVQGVAAEITDPVELAAARALSLRAWGTGEAAERYIRLARAVLTGRRFPRS